MIRGIQLYRIETENVMPRTYIRYKYWSVVTGHVPTMEFRSCIDKREIEEVPVISDDYIGC